ncbi:MAG: M20/M25/M40 family metallo-hydrolase [Armatimonadetes bacterium]|nr:M20/M25/M40 family metallo-hydrolase [Armatimonadota bacterium]
MNSDELIALHAKLVSIHSVSHGEKEIADFIESMLRESPATVTRLGDCVIARRGSGPRLLLNSHFDTVPAVDGWDTDPWKPTSQDGKVIGLGSNDAKASVAAMIAAFLTVPEDTCEVTLMLVPEEETGGKGTEVAWPWLRDSEGWIPQGVVVGEPTELQVGIAQKGLMILELTAMGDACHSANASELGAVNPIWLLAEDIAALRAADLGKPHPMLGMTTLQPTKLQGAQASNQVPGEARATLDLRTVPGESHSVLLERLQNQVKGELHAKSIRLQPYDCPEGAAIVRAALRANPGSGVFASRTMSDQVFFQGVPAIKCGPGKTERSHTANEFVLESELIAGAEFYRKQIAEFARENQ